MARLHAACALAALLLACRTARPGVPAVILDPTQESRAALAEAVSAAVGGRNVTLAPDAFTRESTLVLERSRVRDPYGLPANGRELRAPERFRLVKEGGACVLVHERTGRRFTLAGTTCAER